MAYEKQTWETGQVITADKLNHMEDGIASNGVLTVTITTTGTLPNISAGGVDKTYDEILAAYRAGKTIIFIVRASGSSGPADVSAIGTYVDYVGGSFMFGGINFSYVISGSINSSGNIYVTAKSI